jgi:hypothetical protein
MAHLNRRTAPKVRNGKVQRKNRQLRSPSYWRSKELIIDRERPGDGYRHLLRQKDVFEFVELIPDWQTLAKGLHAILLAQGEAECFGWHRRGVIGLCAWERDIVQEWPIWFYDDVAELLERLNVPCRNESLIVHVAFTEATARDFQLLHILTHELGHHRDRMTNRGSVCARGEPYADEQSRTLERQVWDAYSRRSGR